MIRLCNIVKAYGASGKMIQMGVQLGGKGVGQLVRPPRRPLSCELRFFAVAPLLTISCAAIFLSSPVNCRGTACAAA